jgi:hypothetical protein
MATDKTFSVCGVSTSTDGTKVRFANDTMRTKVLHKNGHTDIVLIELATDMTKLAAVEFIKDLPEFAGEDAQMAISEYMDKHAPKAPRAKVERKPAKTEATVVTKPAKVKAAKTEAAPAKSKAEVQAILDEAEDAPF